MRDGGSAFCFIVGAVLIGFKLFDVPSVERSLLGIEGVLWFILGGLMARKS